MLPLTPDGPFLLLYDWCMANDYGASISDDLLPGASSLMSVLPPNARHGSVFPIPRKNWHACGRISPSKAGKMTEIMEPVPPADTLIMGAAPAAPETVPEYQILREIGRGGMSTVYEARDIRTGQSVALKMLALPPSHTPEQRRDLIARFRREARAVAQLSHPNIVVIHEVGERNGAHFLAMEYLKGGPCGSGWPTARFRPRRRSRSSTRSPAPWTPSMRRASSTGTSSPPTS